MMRLLWIVVLAALTFAAPPVAARDLVVGVEAVEYFPVYAMREGEFVGAGREILDAFAKARGHRLSYRPLPALELGAELARGGIDLRFPDNAQWLEDKGRQSAPVVYSVPMIAFLDGVMVRSINFGHGADSVKRLGTLSGFSVPAWDDRIHGGTVTVAETPSLEGLLTGAVVGRMDGAYVNVAVANHALAHLLNLRGALVYDPALPHTKDYYHLSSVKCPDIIDEFNRWMTANQDLVSSIKKRMAAEVVVN